MEMDSSTRTNPNVLIVGTPGSGKTTTSQQLAEETGMMHVDISELVKTKGLHEGKDEARDAFIIDEDKVCDELEPLMAKGGVIVDTHAMVDYFPERWFDLVVVLRVDNTILYDRLLKRGYTPEKVQENVQAEIMLVVAEEARSSYAKEIVQELDSNTVEQLESNVERIKQWAAMWKEQQSAPQAAE